MQSRRPYGTATVCIVRLVTVGAWTSFRPLGRQGLGSGRGQEGKYEVQAWRDWEAYSKPMACTYLGRGSCCKEIKWLELNASVPKRHRMAESFNNPQGLRRMRTTKANMKIMPRHGEKFKTIPMAPRT